MESVETSGRTVDDALSVALRKLGATMDDVELTVLDEGKRGFLFGAGAREARVRVELKRKPAQKPRPPGRAGDEPDAEQAARSGRRGDRGGGGQRGRDGGRDRDREGGRPRSGRRDSRAGLEDPMPSLSEADFFGAKEDASPAPDTRSRDSGERPRPASRARDDEARPSRGSRGGGRRSPSREPRERTDITPDINAEEVEFAASIVDDLLTILDIGGDISIREPVTPGDGLGSARAVIDISGDDLGFLIGRRGETLMSFQYIVNLIVTRSFPNRGSITVDVEGYRQRREEQIISLAERMADRVRQTGSPITLEPMTAAERRLVHLLLADDPELETSSTGDEPARKVVIAARR